MKFGEALKNRFSTQEYDETEYEEYEAEMEENMKPAKRKGSALVGGKSKQTSRVIFRELFEFKHAVEVCESLSAGATVVCNLQRCDNTTIRRIVDFLSGTAYVLQGEIRRSGDRIFICVPNNVTLDGKYHEDLLEAQQHAKKSEAGYLLTAEETDASNEEY